MEERVQKIIANSGYCSRRRAEVLIEGKKVKVNNKLITIGDKADPEKDKITVNGKLIKLKEKVYIALWKPKKVVSTLYDPEKRKTVKDLINKLDTRVYPVGRLDNMAEGLLLMTNDGDFANKIMHPRHKIKKIYLVRANRELTSDDFDKLKKGITLDEMKVKPDRLVNLGDRLYEITLHQGLNRVVKRLFESLGYGIYALLRIQVAGIKLEGIKRGQWRHLTNEEINSIN